MASMTKLRLKAKELGIPTSEIRKASTTEELEDLMATATQPRKKKSVVAAKKKSVREKTSPTKSKKTAKPVVETKAARKVVKRSNAPDAGKHFLGDIDWSQTDGWTCREDSTPDRIVSALQRYKGDREKAFNFLVDKFGVFELVAKNVRTGRKRTKDEAEDFLRFLISRYAWIFATRTGQHAASSNRAEYGTAGTGAGLYKRDKKKVKKAEDKPKRGRGRPPKAKAEAPKRGRGRPKKETTEPKRGRGRPKKK